MQGRSCCGTAAGHTRVVERAAENGGAAAAVLRAASAAGCSRDLPWCTFTKSAVRSQRDSRTSLPGAGAARSAGLQRRGRLHCKQPEMNSRGMRFAMHDG